MSTLTYTKNRVMRINGKKLIWHANCLDFEAAKLSWTWKSRCGRQNQGWIQKYPGAGCCWKPQSVGMKEAFRVSYRWLSCLNQGWFPLLIQQPSCTEQKWCFGVRCFTEASSFPPHGPGEQGMPSHVISPALGNYHWEQECAAEVIYVMHCHLLCLYSNYDVKLKSRK